jgi:tRNA U34 5-carboxymethylaminomethyl modifying GTPase MnmE/TrmE
MNQSNNLTSFYNSLNSIDIVNTNLDEKRDDLKTIILNFDKNIQKRVVDKKLSKQNEQLGALLNNTIDKLKYTSTIWVDNFTKLLEQEKFRSDLENYFIIIIFGKVKAGKSSLGNFIAKNNTTDKKPIFFKYDEAGNEQAIKKLQEIDDENSGFDTNNLECTTEIQGFKLGGMAWIDTPGLGSMVQQNGELAKKYIQNADYIIYPTSSNSPLQQDEIAQIKELFKQKKQVSICITKSDTKERQKDSNDKYKRDKDGKIAKFIVNKSQDNRAKQEQYVNNEIKQLILNKHYKLGDIFSISTHTAQYGIDTQNKTLFQNSHIPKFYELITDVVKQKASSLKASTPYNGLLSFIENDLFGDDNTNGSLGSLESSLKYFDTQVKEASERFETIKQNTNSDIESEIDFVVSQYMSEIDKTNLKEKLSLIDEELNKSITCIVNKNIEEILKNFNTSLNSLKKILTNTDEYEIKDKYEEIEVFYEDRDFINRVTFGRFGNRTSSVEESVYIGNNKDKVILKFKKNRTNAYMESAVSNYEMVISTFFNPLEKISNDIKKDINSLKQDITTYKNNLKG